MESLNFKLKPCPFCGYEEVTIKQFVDLFLIKCHSCEAEGPTSVNQEKAVHLWNNRYPYETGEEPEVNEVWKHYNGNLYEVLMLTNTSVEQTDKYPHTIVYKNINNGTVWSRRLDDWHRSFTFVESSHRR